MCSKERECLMEIQKQIQKQKQIQIQMGFGLWFYGAGRIKIRSHLFNQLDPFSTN